MTIPIQAPPPVNATITIQPVNSPPTNREGAAASPLAGVATGTLVQGFVVNRDGQNNPILRTNLGDVRVTSSVFLRTGSEVVFRVDGSQASLARIISVDGLTPENYSAQGSRVIARDVISQSSLSLPPASTPGQASRVNALGGTLGNSNTLQAIVLQPQAPAPSNPSLLASALAAAQTGPAPLIAQLTQLRAGATIRLTLLDLKLPAVAIALASVPTTAKLDALLASPSVATPQPQPLPGSATAPAATPSTSTPSRNAANTAASFAPTAAAQAAASAPDAAAVEQAAPSGASIRQTGAPAPVPAQAAGAGAPSTTPPGAGLASSPAPSTNTAPPVATPAPTVAPPAAAAASIATRSTSISAPIPAASPGVPIAPGTTSAANLLTASNTPPAPNIAASVSPALVLTPASPNQIVADVIGHDADGANILHTAFASLKLYTPQPLPVGTTLLAHVDAESTTTATTSAPASATTATAATPLATSTPASLPLLLDQAVQWLRTHYPEAALEAQLRLPSLSPRFASTILSYITQVRQGSVDEILGKRAVRLLESGAAELLASLRESLQQTRVQLSDAPALAPWIPLAIPLYLGQEIRPIQLFLPPDAREHTEESNRQNRGQRFILDLSLSALGPMQLDGFVRGARRDTSFDLILRSERSLPEAIGQDIRTIFTQTLETTGITGQLFLQHGAQHFIRLETAAAHTSGQDRPHTILA